MPENKNRRRKSKELETERPKVVIRPLSAERWADFEALFGAKGACGGCWCMWWRLPQKTFDANRGDRNKQALKRVLSSGRSTGLIAYVGKQPVGWCAIAPRTDYPRLARSRVLRKVDDLPVWSVTCFFVNKAYRGKGITVELLKAAVQYARKKGAVAVEGYPVDPKSRYADTFAYVGLKSAFDRAGFQEVARHSLTRPIMRYRLDSRR